MTQAACSLGLRQILVERLKEAFDGNPLLRATRLRPDTWGLEDVDIHAPPPVSLQRVLDFSLQVLVSRSRFNSSRHDVVHRRNLLSPCCAEPQFAFPLQRAFETGPARFRWRPRGWSSHCTRRHMSRPPRIVNGRRRRCRDNACFQRRLGANQSEKATEGFAF